MTIRTPDIERLVADVHRRGSVAAVVELLCRTRATFDFAQIVKSCALLGISPQPKSLDEIAKVVDKCAEAGLLQREHANSVRSLVVGKMP